MSIPEKARIGLAGVGVIGKRHISAVIDCPAAELVGIADSDPARLSAAACGVPEFECIESMISATEPDGVIVATPTDRHLQPVLAALEADCSVLVEKPVAAVAEDGLRIAEAERQSEGRVLVGHHRRYNPASVAARNLIESGELGKLVQVSGQWGVRKHDGYYEEHWRRTPSAGPVLINLSHEIDLLRFICGEIVSISAETTNEFQGFEKEDAAAAVMRFKCGALGTITITDRANSPWAWEFATGENTAFPVSGENCYRFFGTKMSLDFPRLTLWSNEREGGNWFAPIASKDINPEPADAFALQIEHFSKVARGLALPFVTAMDAVNSLRATLAVFESANSGKRVEL